LIRRFLSKGGAGSALVCNGSIHNSHDLAIQNKNGVFCGTNELLARLWGHRTPCPLRGTSREVRVDIGRREV